VWTDTDPDRSGMLPFVFEDGFGFERYVDYMLDVPMYLSIATATTSTRAASRSAISWPAACRRCPVNCR
jgi:gamma-glutamylcysteine synthetase